MTKSTQKSGDASIVIGRTDALARTNVQPVTRISDLSSQQWKSGIAAWLGWLFDGLDMHLYTLVAVTFVADLLGTQRTDPQVGYYSSWIQAAFLIGID